MSTLRFDTDGRTTEKFVAVADAFKENFTKGWEREGAAIAVYHKGELVVDLWGGYADTKCARPWRRDTMTTVFSCSKALCALSLAHLVDNGLLKYDALVTEYWPEFGKHGKHSLTVKQLATHQAGLAAVDREIGHAQMQDWRKMAVVFEEQEPNWTLNEQSFGYHAVTYGFLVDQLVRRVDAQQRSVGQYVQQELIQPTGSEEFYIGLPPELEHRVARLRKAGLKDFACHFAFAKNNNLKKLVFRAATKNVPPLTRRAFLQPDFIMKHTMAGLQPFNNPEVHQLEIGAANGIGTARGLAQPFSALVTDQLLNKRSETRKTLEKPVFVDQKDIIIDIPVSSGHGFAYAQSPASENCPVHWVLGHPGSGGQNVKADFEHQLAFAYISNSLKSGIGDHVRTFEKLQQAVYSCL